MSLLHRKPAPPVSPPQWAWVEDGLLEINGTLYSVRAIHGGYELRKAGSAEPHHVHTEGEPWSCTCGDHVWRGRECKHLLALRAAFAEGRA